MSTVSRYQSPITLCVQDASPIQQSIHLLGQIESTIYDASSKNFNVQNPVFLTVNNKTYRLQQYHFHVPGEHIVDGRKYAGEVHFVFVENGAVKSDNVKHLCCNHYENGNILVIGRMLKDSPNEIVRLAKYPVSVPSQFFEYDGGLTTGDFTTPVRWIVGKNPLSTSIKELEPIAKDSREIQPLDGRLIAITSKIK